MTIKWTIGLAITSLLVCGACKSEPDDVLVETVEETADRPSADTERSQHIADLEQRLDTVGSKLDKMDKDMSADLSEAKRKSLKDLRDKQTALTRELDEAKRATADEWTDLKGDLDRGMDDLEDGYNDLLDSLTNREHEQK